MLLFSVATIACTGTIGQDVVRGAVPGDPPDNAVVGDAGGTPVVAADCNPDAPRRQGASPLRRLSRFEYNNTIRDLLGDDSHPADKFLADGEAHGFTNSAAHQSVSLLLAEQFMTAAETLATRAMTNPARVLNCDPLTVGQDVCAQTFINTFAQRAFRRPITPEENSRLSVAYNSGKREQDFAAGIRLVMVSVLQSSAFLYRFELTPTSGAALGPWEMASRLSYLLWGSMPDTELFLAAANGELASADDITRQARRMLADPRARRMIDHFNSGWLGLDRLDHLVKDRAVYPSATPGLPALWRRETETFLNEVIWNGDGTLTSLLTAPYTFANDELAQRYGVTTVAPVSTAFSRIALDPKQRAGLLTQAGLLAASSKPNQTSPIHRGLFVRERLLCESLPPPPDGIEIKPPDLDPNLTTRQRFDQHASDPACAGCHQLMDPIGLGFENYDGLGSWRTTENGQPIDASGEIVGTDIEGPFRGAVDLAGKLASSADVQDCVVRMWFRFGYGRSETDEDACTLAHLNRAFDASGRRVQDLVLALTQAEAFRHHAPSAQDSP
jgi:Protein of unknown function (DUF1592)/Protein of unknown function (DUF1588)/Protein of unknown function (DUF1587)/Protein of unknown function (DUF1595)/Protein of unknown function (DUF1585)